MRTALAAFHSSLAKIEDITIDLDASVSAALASRAVMARHETIQCACTAILSGFFETFIRETAEGFITQVDGLRIPFMALPAPIQYTHHEKGGTVLQAKRKNKPKYGWVTAPALDIQRRLASVSAVPYELVWEAFADTQANPGVDVIKDILNSFALNPPFSRIATHTTLSETMLKLNLDSFLAVRNQCVHTGTASTIPTPADIRGHCTFFKDISTGIAHALEQHLLSPAFNRALAVPLPMLGTTATAAPSTTGSTAPALARLPARARAWLSTVWRAIITPPP